MTKTFDGVLALDGVSADLRSGEIVALIGPNGAGKTTLLDVLSGFGHPHGGSRFVDGQNITSYSPAATVKAGVARSFQHRHSLRTFSVLEQIMLAVQPSVVESVWRAILPVSLDRVSIEARAMSLANGMGLEHLVSHPAATLSFGQQKLLGLACCAATGASALLLDEPFAGVHPAAATELKLALEKLRREGKAIMFVEHDLQAVRTVADRVLVLDRGRLLADGRPDEVLRQSAVIEAYIG